VAEAYQGPQRGADRAVLLAHGAGTDHTAPPLVTVANALADADVPTLRFDFPYKAAGRKAPDRAPVLLASLRDAAAELARRTDLPLDRVVVGGRSMGGRMASLAVADEDDPLPALGLLLLGYPLHPAGKPEVKRDDHFRRITVPSLLVSGTRDALAPRKELVASTRKIKGTVTREWLESADHGFRPLKSSGHTYETTLALAAAVVTEWVAALI
jgi:predicted alpha/beta-hydrolase family hydrolase